MKKLAFILLAMYSLLACNNKEKTGTPQTTIDDNIKKIETSLVNEVFIEGDSTWTIEGRMEHYGIPGMTMAVIKDFKIEYVKSYGFTDKEHTSAVTSTTLFQAGSISKPVAAYGALKMVEQKKLDLDDDINKYLVNWKLPENEFTKEKKVALKHLLSHTGGLTVHGFPGYSPDLTVPTLVQVLDGVPPANTAPIRVDKKPEESFRYSGGGYCIIQQMMIDAEKKTFPAIMKELVLQPLQMTHSTYDQPLQQGQIELAATGYLPDGTMTKGKRHTYPEMAAAGLWTTAEDLAKFAIDIQKTLKGEGEAVVSQGMVKKMLTPFVEDYIGLGIFLDKKKDDVYFGHGGWDEGFCANLIAHKEKGYGVVIMINSNHPQFMDEVKRSVALTYGWDNYVPTYKKLPIDSASLHGVSGRYKLGNDEFIEIQTKGNRLFSRSLRDSNELFRIDEKRYISHNRNQPVEFEKDSKTGKFTLLITNPDDGKVETRLVQLESNEKLPIEWLEQGNFEEAFKSYEKLKRSNPKDPAIQENNLNQRGYSLLYGGNPRLAQDLFKVNMLLHPKSANVYDSYAEACMNNGDLDLAILNYRKSLELNPQNQNAIEKLQEIKKKKEAVSL